MKKKAIVTIAAAAAVIAAAQTFAAAESYEVSFNGKKAELSSAPFVENSEVYLPLREVLNAAGVANEAIGYDNGKITVTMYSAAADKNVTAEITAGEPGVRFDADRDNYKTNGYSGGKRTTSHPVILKDGVTYAPMGVFRRIADYGLDTDYESTENKSEYFDDFRYSRATRFLLIDGLEVKKIYDDGQFDVLLSRRLDVKGDNKYSPEAYYSEGERVIIGTPERQNESWPEYNNVNGYYFPADPIKRIITDDEGRVSSIVLVQNQYHETLDRDDLDTWGASFTNGFERLGGAVVTSDGKAWVTGEGYGENRVNEEGENMAELYFWIPAYLMVQPR